MNLKDLLYIVVVTPPFFLVIFILFMAIKRPQIVRKSSKEASRDRPSYKAYPQALLGMFYALDELRQQKEYKLIYIVGVIGAIGTAILLILYIIFLYLPARLELKI